MKQACPMCGQPLEHMRAGIRLTPLKADIFDAIKRRGPHLIKSAEIASQIGHRQPEIVKQHITQINDILEETDWRIEGVRGKDGGYRLVRRRSNGS